MKTREISRCPRKLAGCLIVGLGACSMPGPTGTIDGPSEVEPSDAIAQTSPPDGATAISTETVIAVSFSKAVEPDSADVWIEPEEVDFDQTWSGGNTVLTLVPTRPLEPATDYRVHIGELVFEDGSELADEFSFRFTTADGETALRALSLDEVRFWGYQIQGLDEQGAIDALAESHYDMLVLEPTRTDAELSEFDTSGMVARLKSTLASDGIHRKLILAYVDIGEAEDWRWSWAWSEEAEEAQIPQDVDLPEDWPEFIVARDPDGWVGNYPVAYWDPEWKDIMIYGGSLEADETRDYASAIDEVIIDGFDGIYLDWVEGFENVHVIEAAEARGLDPAREMIDFIAELGEYARQRDPGFLVVQQNAAGLLTENPDLLDHVDAIAQEGVWYDGVAGDDWNDVEGYFMNDEDLTDEYLGLLAAYLDAGVPVFVCEYALQDTAADAYERAAIEGYVPYVTRRSLSRLTDTPPGY